MGRPNKYFSNIKPFLKDIKDMCTDMNEEDVARRFGISKQSWYSYKKKYKEFDEIIKDVHANNIARYKKNLRKIADGYTYTETKEYVRDESGKVIKEIYVKTVPPSEKANHLLLSNLDSKWSENPKELEIKKKELKIKEDNAW